MSGNFETAQVGPDTWVTLSYRAYDAEGDLVDESPEDSPVTVVYGYGQLLPAVETAIAGLSAGQTRSVTLQPSEAFGERDTRALIEVDRADFPEDVAAGDLYEVENEEGEVLVLKVLEVAEDFVVVDTNHPLAGQRVRIELSVRDVRPASTDEIDEAQASLLAASEPSDPSESSEPELISVERLLRGGTQR